MHLTYRGRHRRRRNWLLTLPAAGVLAAVIIHPGNTMSGIAASHGVTLGALEAANPQVANPNLIYAGQSLNLPGAVRPAVTGGSAGARLLAKAESQAGTPYVWGGAAPGGFDCSGLVSWAAAQTGVKGMPRSTYDMLGAGVASGVLTRVYSPQPGDLAFFGSGHVELYAGPGRTFGAHKPGTAVSFAYFGGTWVPTGYYRVM